MKILLIYPETPSTFWSFRHALKFVSLRSSEPPLGLLTVAAMLPEHWEKKLIDMNVSRLTDKQIRWADYVFLSGMDVHRQAFQALIRRCKALGAKIVAGGPMVTTDYVQFPGVDHFVLNEAEITLPLFLRDLEAGCPQHIYSTDQFPDIAQTPVPLWRLLDMKKYAAMSIQYSRGCPFNCEFCSVTQLNGHQARTKSAAQFLHELDTLYTAGWRGNVFIVDDNFIGNKRLLKSDLLPALIAWSQAHRHPYTFTTEVSINLADDEELVRLLVQAGMRTVFVGIETPNAASLAECGKAQNLQRDIVTSVKKLQRSGLMVHGGFIVGFDNDPHTIFEDQIRFIQKSGIVTAMVGLLTALSGTHLFRRLKSENRLLDHSTGNNMDGSLNFEPKMNRQKLLEGYKSVLNTIYSQKAYYERVTTFLREYHLPQQGVFKVTWRDIRAFFRSIWKLGVLENGRRYYWKLLLYTLWNCPKKFSLTVMLAIYGFHFRRVIESV
ncbi:MAG TPA: DUF4070 domain-containing protein [bacterium]|nr:DUF4070 domain-containing protein [bacterium]HPN42464.1 DUF4070 domain-containing protein [bacterium]